VYNKELIGFAGDFFDKWFYLLAKIFNVKEE